MKIHMKTLQISKDKILTENHEVNNIFINIIYFIMK
jgi:hypothetical protein